jgi:hypothetical protein
MENFHKGKCKKKNSYREKKKRKRMEIFRGSNERRENSIEKEKLEGKRVYKVEEKRNSIS